MTDTLVDLRFEREKASDNNAEVRPQSVVRMCLEDIENREDITRVLIIVESKLDDGDYDVEQYRAGCTRYEEVALLELAKDFTLQKWRRP